MAAPIIRSAVKIFHRKISDFSNILGLQRRCRHCASVADTVNSKEVNRNATVRGWVKAVRNHKGATFLHINDGSSSAHLQVVCNGDLLENNLFGSSVEIHGKLVESPGQGQDVEMMADTIKVLGECDTMGFPLKARTRHPPDYVRQHLHLRPRTNIFSSLLRIRNTASQAIHQYFQKNDFCEVHTPVITTNDCEGAGEVFSVEPLDRHLVNDLDPPDTSDESSADERKTEFQHFFKQPAFLTVSGQLHLETVNGAFSKVYTFGPTFRAENSFTRNHLSEFYMVEAEVAFIDRVDDLMELIEDLIKTTTDEVLKTSSEDCDLYFKHVAPKKKEALQKMLNNPFRKITYTEAVELLQKSVQRFHYKPEWGEDLKKEHERFLTSHFDNVPVFVVDFPAGIKPFYAKLNDDNCRTAAAVDLLFPEVGEVVGGTLREHNADTLEKRLQLSGLIEHFQWYLDLRRYGSIPHGGFGLGFERYLQYLLGVNNIRDVIPFPRWPKHCQM